ncbi:hypothetical protein HOLleu_35175 [Holothuria leucospilota]|uniref:Endonuclease/exonuclease/phosphatase domain-containing protein n=1 Tax=Holothuria leucospilota TaxID=206669 RepID=A0A9Q0YMD4_HOLLE|nr:hypothetical protein HOLleu_35175 [Holothuria leucospilota]
MKNFNAFVSFMNSIDNYQFTLIAITETWLNDLSPSNTLQIDGYKLLYKNRLNKRGGGVALFIKENLHANIRADLSQLMNDSAETLFVEIENSKTRNTLVGVIYRPPEQNVNDFLDCTGNCLEALNYENKNVFLTGDFNITLLTQNVAHNVQELVNIMSLYSFYPLIDKPTRVTTSTSSLIDNIFTNVANHILKSGVLVTDISDHYPIFCVIQSKIHTLSRKNVYKNNTCRKNINYFKSELSNVDWSFIMNDENVDSAYSNFSKVLLMTFNKCCPYTQVHQKIKYEESPWITFGILKSIRHTNKLYSRYIQSPTLIRKIKYTKYKNVLTAIINLAKKLYFSNLIEDHKSDPTHLWKVINGILNKKQNSDSNRTFISGNDVISNEDEVANHFNKYFSSVALDLVDKLPTGKFPPQSYMKSCILDSFMFFPTNTEEVKLSILRLKNGKSPGFDYISNDILKHVVDIILYPLTHIINLSFSNGVFPSELKIAKIVPIFKSSDQKFVSNYRQISILPSISKIFERLAYDRLYNFIVKHKILYEHQYGFRNDHSTYMAALSLIDKIAKGLDNRLTTVGIFIDLS